MGGGGWGGGGGGGGSLYALKFRRSSGICIFEAFGQLGGTWGVGFLGAPETSVAPYPRMCEAEV